MNSRIQIICLNILLIMSIQSCKIKTLSTPKIENKMNALSELDSLISILKSDRAMHKDIVSTVSDKQIEITENELGIKLPASYKYFLKEFGNGAYWLYHVDQPINGVDKEYGEIHWLGKHRRYIDDGDEIPSDGFGTFKTNSLLCLITENSNGGAWCWLTNKENGEWPLAYYNMGDKLYYKIPNFVEWLKIATKCKEEVIRELDTEYRLGLG